MRANQLFAARSTETSGSFEFSENDENSWGATDEALRSAEDTSRDLPFLQTIFLGPVVGTVIGEPIGEWCDPLPVTPGPDWHEPTDWSNSNNIIEPDVTLTRDDDFESEHLESAALQPSSNDTHQAIEASSAYAASGPGLDGSPLLPTDSVVESANEWTLF